MEKIDWDPANPIEAEALALIANAKAVGIRYRPGMVVNAMLRAYNAHNANSSTPLRTEAQPSSEPKPDVAPS
jgi:hypothetical protein